MTWRWREFCCKNADLRKWNKKIIIGSGKGEDLVVWSTLKKHGS